MILRIPVLSNIIEENAPLKTRKVKKTHVHLMNDELRKCINVKNMLHRFWKTI